MKNIKLSLLVVLFTILQVSCSKESKEPGPQIKDDTEEGAHYQINLSIETDNYDKPDEKEILNYTFEFKDGTFSEKGRKINGITITPTKIRTVAEVPVGVMAEASIELIDLNEIASSLTKPSINADVTSGVVGAPSIIFLRGIDNKPTPNLSNLPIIQVVGSPDRFTQNILILAEAPDLEVLKAPHEIKLDINDDEGAIGTIIIPVEIDTELATFDLTATRKSTQNQALESITYEGINGSNWPDLAYKHKHVVGGDGCPMPLWDFSINMTNNISSEMKDMFSYGITGLNNIDAVDISYPGGSTPTTVEYFGQNYPFFPPNNSGNFQAEFQFNCIRAQNVNAEGTTLTVIYLDEMTGHPILDAPIPFNVEMQ